MSAPGKNAVEKAQWLEECARQRMDMVRAFPETSPARLNALRIAREEVARAQAYRATAGGAQ